MESTGKPDRIQVTEAARTLLREQYRFESRGEVEIKGKGRMPTYFVVAGKDAVRESNVSAHWWASASDAPGKSLEVST